MYLVVSHFTKNKWTTDYWLDFLEWKKISYYYLRHPFTNDDSITHSEIIYFDGNTKSIIATYKKLNSSILDMMRNYVLTLYIWWRFHNKITKVIWFGWFNTVPVIYLRIFHKIVYFWWVDYSKKRFSSSILNKIYLAFETLSCHFSNQVISSSQRQQEARIENHWLTLHRSMIVPNGINNISFEKEFFQYKNTAFFYLGSITLQHGIIDFIQYFYIDHPIAIPLYIIGWWEKEYELQKLISEHHLAKRVIFLWTKSSGDIESFLEQSSTRFIGIAPYSDMINDHVYYGDSLKLKEYLRYNIPYLTSNIVQIPDDLQEFGMVYENFRDINLDEIQNFSFSIVKKNAFLKKYFWDTVFISLFQ